MITPTRILLIASALLASAIIDASALKLPLTIAPSQWLQSVRQTFGAHSRALNLRTSIANPINVPFASDRHHRLMSRLKAARARVCVCVDESERVICSYTHSWPSATGIQYGDRCQLFARVDRQEHV